MADTPAPEVEKLPVVAWRVDDPYDVGPTLTSDPEKARFHFEIGRDVAALCRLSDATALIASKDAEIRRIRDIRNENAEDCRTEIRHCREEIARLRADAERYRWLRDETEWEPFDSAWLQKVDIYGCPSTEMDAAIDAAFAAQAKGGE